MAIKTARVAIHGKYYTLEYNPVTDRYEAEIIAPSNSSGMNNNGLGPGVPEICSETGGSYPVTLQVIDDAGNAISKHYTDPVLGPSLRLYVYETDAPDAEISIDDGIVRDPKPFIKMSVADEGSGINKDSFHFYLDDVEVEVSLVKENEILYTASYTPEEEIPDGQHTLRVVVSDYDKNETKISKDIIIDAYKSVIFISNDEVIDTQIIPYGDCAKPLTLKREGYAFLGWYCNSLLFDFSAPIISDIELITKWKLMDNRWFILQLLKDDWVDYNAPRPKMVADLNIHTADLRYSILEVKQLTETVTPVGLGYITQDRKVAITITIRGPNQNTVMAQANETIRCLQSRRRNPGGGFDLLKVEGIMNVENGHNYARITVDCTLLTYSENID